jgi:hypothetical protein
MIYAQVSTLKGKVSCYPAGSNTGIPSDSALITIKNVLTNDTLSIYSQKDGSYFFININAGKYDLKARFRGYAVIVIRDIVVEKNQITFQDITFGKADKLEKRDPKKKKKRK